MEWKKYKLGEIADVIGGVAYDPADITSDGIRIVRGGNIQNGVLLQKNDDVFLPASYANVENQVYKYDTIVVSSTGSLDALAKAATVFEDMPNTQIGAFLRIIRPKEEKFAMLVSAWCTSRYFRDYIVRKTKGTSINNIRTKILTDFDLQVPDLYQLELQSRLYANYCRKIELNRQINQNLCARRVPTVA